MFFLILVVGAGIVGIRFWMRVQAMESTIAELAARVDFLERRPAAERPQPAAAPEIRKPAPRVAPTVQPPASTPAPTPTSTPIPTPMAPSAPCIELPVAPSPEPIAAASRDALETRIGSRWLLYVGVVAIVIGVSYFEKLAIDNHWVSETARVVQGGIVGLLLIFGGLQFVRKGYSRYGQILSGCGIAILYVSTYAAFNFYRLISQPAAFGLMSAVTMLAAWLATRQRSQGLALVAIGGGFATPFLLPSATDAEAALFGYDAILIAGTMYLSRRRDWPTLNVVGYAFTVLTVLGWMQQFYTQSKYLETELFITLFCGMFVYMLQGIRGSGRPSAPAERAVLWTAPFGYYVLSLFILAPHSPALLVYLVVLSLAGVVVGTRSGAWSRLVFFAMAALPLLLWSDEHGGRAWLSSGLIAWAAVYVLNLAGLLEGTLSEPGGLSAGDIALLHLNGLAAFGGAYLLVEPVSTVACAPLAAAFALVNGALAFLVLKGLREEALHFAALAFTFVTIAIALQFDGAAATSGWAAEGAIVMWLGLRERREWLRAGGLVLFSVSVVRLLGLQLSDPPVGQLLLLNRRAFCGAFVVALTYALSAAHERGGKPETRRLESAIGLVAAKLLLLTLAASEIAGYWALHVAPPFEPAAELIDAALVCGAVIVWLGLRRQQEWVRGVGAAVVAAAALCLFAMQTEGAPLTYTVVLNARAASGVLAVLLLYALALLHRRIGEHVADLAANIAILTVGASLLTLSLLTSEIDAYWAARGAAHAWSIAREALQTMVWGGIGGFLIWHGLSNRRAWMRAIGGGVLLVAVLRALNLQAAAAAAGYIVVANARVVASIVVVAVLYGLATLYRNATDLREGQYVPATVLWMAGNVVTLTLLTSEITAYWQLHQSALTSANSHFAREMMLSITWAAYATLLIVVGLRQKYAPIRYFAMTVFVITIVKVFAIDLAELDRMYRVLSVIGLGVMLLLTSYLYQKLSDSRTA
jgi:hypothetical protein